MSAIAELSEERVVEGIYAVARKQRLRTKGGAPYLALELVDPSGRIDARVWHDVELLDARFAEGDAVRVLGRVEKFRNRLQVDVRTLEAAPEADPAEFAPTLRRDADELDGFLEFLAGEISHEGLAGIVTRFFSDDVLRASLRRLPASENHHSYAGGLLEHTVGVATICRETAQLHPRLRSDLLLAAALLHDVGRVAELTSGPTFRQAVCSGTSTSVCAWSRSGVAGCSRTRAQSSCMQSPVITTHEPRARPRRRCCITQTSSTRSPRRGRSPTNEGADSAAPHRGRAGCARAAV
jgi:3'-5' exoribonuclease